LLSAIKYAKYYELTEKDVVMTVFTDSMELYDSRMKEMEQEHGAYKNIEAATDFDHLQNLSIDHTLELTHYEKKRIHNLKYYTWIEQQDRQLEELNRQWYDHHEYWDEIHRLVPEIDKLIREFNDLR
ncbi:MAG: pyridoxal-5-phosphate-dependent protein subunit beta, partial [Bacteroidota bacterium]